MRLQANLGARLHDANPVTRRGYLSSEHVFDAGASLRDLLRCMSPCLRLELTRLFFKLGAPGRMTGQRDAVDFQTAGTVAQI
jgi:hypothetical protein